MVHPYVGRMVRIDEVPALTSYLSSVKNVLTVYDPVTYLFIMTNVYFTIIG